MKCEKETLRGLFFVLCKVGGILWKKYEISYKMITIIKQKLIFT